MEDFFLQNNSILYTNDVLKGRNHNNPQCIINPGALKVDVHQKEDTAITKLYVELSRKFEKKKKKHYRNTLLQLKTAIHFPFLNKTCTLP